MFLKFHSLTIHFLKRLKLIEPTIKYSCAAEKTRGVQAATGPF